MNHDADYAEGYVLQSIYRVSHIQLIQWMLSYQNCAFDCQLMC